MLTKVLIRFDYKNKFSHVAVCSLRVIANSVLCVQCGKSKTDIFMVRAMSVVWLNDRKRAMDLMLMLGLNKAIDQLAMANSVCWYCHVLMREDCHI